MCVLREKVPQEDLVRDVAHEGTVGYKLVQPEVCGCSMMVAVDQTAKYTMEK